jgi:hypothetical protein
VPGNSIASFKAAFTHVVTLLKSTGAPFKYQLSYNVKSPNNDPTRFYDFYPGDVSVFYSWSSS